MPYMTRNPSQPGVSNYETSPGQAIQFFEERYTTPGPQPWIYAPDAGRWAVTVFFNMGAGAAFIEGTDESPNDIQGVIPPGSDPVRISSSHYYPLTETVTDATRIIVEGCTAVRINVLGGTVDVTARC